jgi:hypothetical protein
VKVILAASSKADVAPSDISAPTSTPVEVASSK